MFYVLETDTEVFHNEILLLFLMKIRHRIQKKVLSNIQFNISCQTNLKTLPLELFWKRKKFEILPSLFMII